VRYLTLDRPDVLNARVFSELEAQISAVAAGLILKSVGAKAGLDAGLAHETTLAAARASRTGTAKHCRGRWSSRQAWASTNRFT
jgi:hypothetical protein